MKIAVVFVLLSLSLGACGQKGPLYLPQPSKPQPPASQTQSAQPKADQPQANQPETPAE
ncbi:LPS translocon maturation chaperone LptM [Cellvibrio sp.]|jgi:predicted small lipoprotein YifL